MDKLDFKKRDKLFYSSKQGRWDRVTVPQMTYVAIDGMGDPDQSEFARAVGALYPVAYGLKFMFKKDGADFVVPPLQALWWADDPSAFVTEDRQNWRWRGLIRLPDATTRDQFKAARAAALAKLARKTDAGTDAETLHRTTLIQLTEGDSLQTLHIGPYAAEAPVLAHLHNTLMPDLGLWFNGPHHEIYLSDPRRAAPEKLRTVLRQPVAPEHKGNRAG